MRAANSADWATHARASRWMPALRMAPARFFRPSWTAELLLGLLLGRACAGRWPGTALAWRADAGPAAARRRAASRCASGSPASAGPSTRAPSRSHTVSSSRGCSMQHVGELEGDLRPRLRVSRSSSFQRTMSSTCGRTSRASFTGRWRQVGAYGVGQHGGQRAQHHLHQRAALLLERAASRSGSALQSWPRRSFTSRLISCTSSGIRFSRGICRISCARWRSSSPVLGAGARARRRPPDRRR